MIEVKYMDFVNIDPITYIDIQYLDDDNPWINPNGRMLFHFISGSNKLHIPGTYILGIDNRGIYRVSTHIKNFDKDKDSMIKVIGVDIL